MIPSFFQVNVLEGLDLMVTDPSQKMKKYLGEKKQAEMFHARLFK
jgi:hypothetical protein